MDLVTLWFVIIAVLWTGFFFLEGFDFGVAALTSLSTRDDAERRQMLAAIGPVWDADEVWLVTGGIAIFAAFPVWYAAVFPAAYLPLLLVICGLIVRGVAIEYRSKRPGAAWRGRWDAALATSSIALPLLFGIFWTGMLHGIPINADGVFVGESLLSFINPYSLLGGVTLLAFSLGHGATFLALKTLGPVQVRMQGWSVPLTAGYGIAMLGFAAWTYWSYTDGDPGALAVAALGIVAAATALIACIRRHQLIAFWANGCAVAAFIAQIFIGLYPNALPSTIDDGFTLTLAEAAAGGYTLAVITVVAAVGLPAVIAYQAWSFWVFRRRIARPVEDPAAGRDDGGQNSTVANSPTGSNPTRA